MAPISIDGDDVTGITLDGDAVTEVTMDGDVVWTDDDGNGGDPDPTETMIDDVESYTDDEDFFDTWGVPQSYVGLTTAVPLEGDQSILSDEAYADGTNLDSTTTDGYTYTALMVHGGANDSPAFIVHQQSETDIADGIRCELDGRDDHVDLWVFDDGSILDEDRVEITVPTDYVYKYEMTVTSSDVDVTIRQSDSTFSSSWSYETASFSEFTTISVPNNASYSSGMIGFYGGRDAGTTWDRFTEVDDVS